MNLPEFSFMKTLFFSPQAFAIGPLSIMELIELNHQIDLDTSFVPTYKSRGLWTWRSIGSHLLKAK
jgi:hypothetical protein